MSKRPPGHPNWHKSNALKTMRARPELKGTLLAKGTWDYAIVDELTPQPGDIVIPKTTSRIRFNTNIDSVLRARGIRNLVFTGIATNVCVEFAADAFNPGILRGGVGRRDAPCRAGFCAAGGALQYREIFRMGLTVGDFCGAIGQAAPTSNP